jgi:hypothetical protein
MRGLTLGVVHVTAGPAAKNGKSEVRSQELTTGLTDRGPLGQWVSLIVAGFRGWNVDKFDRIFGEWKTSTSAPPLCVR